MTGDDQRAEDPAGTRTGPALAAAALVALAVCAAYAGTLNAPFELDDHLSVADNASIRDLGNLPRVLAPDALNMVGRPILNLSFALNYAWSGTGVWSYHLVDLAIHAGAALVLLGLVRRTLLGPALRDRFGAAALPLAALIASVWALHPLQTEAVTYVTERAESLMGFLYLLTLYGFARGTSNVIPGEARDDRIWLVASVLFCWLGIGTKEVMVTAPVAVLLYDVAFVSASLREAWSKRRGYYLALFASWGLLAFLVLGHGWRGRTIGFGAGLGSLHYAFTEAWAVVRYVRLAFWPHPLVFDYGGPEAVGASLAADLPDVVLVAAGLAAAVFLWRRSRPAGFLALAFFLLLAPSSSVVPLVLEPIGEHRMYLPLAPLAALVAVGAYACLGRRSFALLGIAALGLGALTYGRNLDYRSPLALWSDSAAAWPASARAQVNLGIQLAALPGREADAVARYREALRLRPAYGEAHYNLALELSRLRASADEIISEYRAALVAKPDFPEARYNLANELADFPADLPEAVAQYEAALRDWPDHAEVHYNLANALVHLGGRRDDAITHYEAALRLDPGNAKAHNNLANQLAQAPGRMMDAIAQYEEALRLDPSLLEAHFNLASRLARLPGKEADAIAQYEEAVRLAPEFYLARFNLAVLLARAGRFDEAAAQLQGILQRHPSDQRAAEVLERVRALQARASGR